MSEPEKGTGLERISAKVHKTLEDFFEWLARKVVSYPKTTIALCVLLTLCLVQGIHVYDEELSADKQFAPRDSRSVTEEEWVVSKFGHQTRSVIIYFVAGIGGNILDYDSLSVMMDFHEWMVEQHESTYGGKTVTYETECNIMPASGTCQQPDSVLSLFGYDRNRLSRSTYASMLNSAEWRQNVPSGSDLSFYMSREVFDNQTGNYVSAEAVKAVYYLQNDKRKVSGIGDEDPEAREWEIDLEELARKTWSGAGNSKHISIYVQAVGAQEKQESDAIAEDVTSLIIGYILTVIFASCVLCRGRYKYSHSMLGMASVISIAMSTFSAYGLAWLIGIKFNNVVQVLVLILLGIGVDDTFVIMESWWDTVVTNMDERMIQAVRHAGPAITITSVTDFIAFLAGSATVLPALRDFCYYAALGIFFDFAYQCTFFVAIAYFDSKRQESNRADCCCCATVKDDSGCIPCLAFENSVRTCVSGDQPWRESEEGFISFLVGHTLPKFTVGTLVGKISVTVLTMFWLAVGIYGCTELKMDFDKEWFVPDGASMKDTFEVRDTYFSKNEIPTWMYFGETSYHEIATQEAIHEAARIIATGQVALQDTMRSWLSEFTEFVQTVSPGNVTMSPNGVLVVQSAFFYPFLLEFTGYTPTPYPNVTAKYISNQLNVLWNPSRDGLLASKIQYQIKGSCTEDGEKSVDCMDDLRSALDPFKDANTNIFHGECFSWSSPFVFWEGFDLMIQEVTRNVSIAVVCVFVLVTILVASVSMGGIVVFMIGCVDICMLGFMIVVNVDVNSVSVVCIVVAIGLAVDYSVHIGHAFLLVKAEPDGDCRFTQRQLRAAYALCKMGPAVVNGALSTFIAIVPLMVAKSYVFTVFFRMFVVIIFFGIYFGVICLPVVLSLVGPDPYTSARVLPPDDPKSALTFNPQAAVNKSVEMNPPRAKQAL
eukprot:TRINITY_DN17856_c0_g1_i3.p1 TRINITY_DN17856_c0_g1~~TRINITY_DN17856_c0_g1_i3.p1  ORF type:complete len:937 (+),score=137.24 TRINITY_DN17856_c0_g1_i3:1728-4538(+)